MPFFIIKTFLASLYDQLIFLLPKIRFFLSLSFLSQAWLWIWIDWFINLVTSCANGSVPWRKKFDFQLWLVCLNKYQSWQTEIQFRSVKLTVVTRIRKHFEQHIGPTFHCYPSDTRQLVYWCKQPTLNSFQTCLYCIYLFKLYHKSVIILPINDSTTICGKISKTWLI